MNRLSIVVPMQGEPIAFEATLASILRNRPQYCQVVVVQSGEIDDPYGLQDEVEFVTVRHGANLGEMFNRAIGVCEGEIVNLVRPGVEVSEGWEGEPLAAFASEANLAMVAPRIEPLCRQSSRQVVKGIGHTVGFRRLLINSGRRRARLVGPSSWCAFYRKKCLELIDARDERLPDAYLDLDINLSLTEAGFQFRPIPNSIVTTEFPHLLSRENERAHGKGAQRAIKRHGAVGGDAAWWRTFVGSLTELVAAPFASHSPWFAIQRIQAWRFRWIDRRYAERLIRLRQRLRFASDFLVDQDSAEHETRSANSSDQKAA